MNRFGYRDVSPVAADERKELVEFATHLAELAGEAILPYFRPNPAADLLKVENKASLDAGYDPVTQADRQAEQVIRSAITARYPEHGVLGEEFGYTPGEGLTWVIDPIDGTRAFIMGLVHWGTLIALFDGQSPILGVMHQPFLGETFEGDGSRALYRYKGTQKIVRTRPCASLGDALCATTSPYLFSTSDQRRCFDRVLRASRHMRYGTDCYAYTMLALGQIDLVIEAGLKSHDVQALIPIIEGAGGIITTWNGTSAAMGGDILACGDSRLYQQAMEEIQSCLN